MAEDQESQPLLPPSAELMPASKSKLQARRYISTSPESSPGLSDKAKGKQRAEPEPELPEPAHERGCNVTIIFSNEESAGGNLDVWVDEEESVGSVKDKIRVLRPNVASNQLRLIHSGRLLTDGVFLLPWLRSLDERVRRQAGGMSSEVSDVIREVVELAGDEQPAPPPPPPRKVYLHCNVGGPLGAVPTPVESEPEMPRRRGFDALLDAGLSPEEVAAMRRQFYDSRGEEVPDLGVGESDEHARALEEQWIEGDLTADTATMSTEGMYTSILHGLLAGFLFNLLPWFFFQDAPLPNFFDAEAEAAELERREEVAAESRERAAHAAEMGVVQPESEDSVSARVALSPLVGGEAVSGVVFSKRMRIGVILGTVINVGLAALGTLFMV